MEGSTARNRLLEYEKELEDSELSLNTKNKYLSDIRKWLDNIGEDISKEAMIAYKQKLNENYKINSINSKLISINRYIKWLGYPELAVRIKRFQSRNSLDNMLTKEAYYKMLDYAKVTGRMKMYYIMKTIACTGIRISELKYITVEVVFTGIAPVNNKGKQRNIYIPPRLGEELKEYCREYNIIRGVIFHGRDKNRVISPAGVWKNLKYIAGQVDVPEEMVYPHSFRHLFAKTYMEKIGNITELADILGHSRLETTWIYTKTSSEEKRESLNILEL